MTFFGADDLIGFVSFPGEQDAGAFGREQQGGTDGLAAVGDKHGLCQTGGAESGFDIVQDIFGALRAAVVGGDEDAVCIFFGNLRHLRALGLVTVAPAAEQAHQVLFRRDVAQGLQHVVQGVRRMGVIDDDA